jgi:hypothetical protein
MPNVVLQLVLVSVTWRLDEDDCLLCVQWQCKCSQSSVAAHAVHEHVVCHIVHNCLQEAGLPWSCFAQHAGTYDASSVC